MHKPFWYARLSFVLLIVSLNGCSFLLDANECESNDDCASGQCNDQICTDRSLVECDNEDDCASGQQCVDQTCTDRSLVECESNNDCTGDNTYCMVGQCRTVDPSICPKLSPAFDEDVNLIPVGGLLPLSGKNADKGIGTANGAELAFSEVNAAGAVDGYRFGLLVCDTTNDVDTATAAARHLVDDLGVRSIIGSGTSGETIGVAQQVTIDANVLLISPAATSPSITDLSDDDLVWRTIASDILQGPALAQRALDQQVDRLAVLAVDSTYGNGLLELVVDHFNEKKPGMVADDSQFRSAKYKVVDGSLAPGAISEVGGMLFGDASAFNPQAVVILGSTESQQIIDAFEETYSLSDKTDPPAWLLTEAGKEPGLLDAKFEPAWTRISGTSIQQTKNDVYQSFQVNYSAEYGDNPVDFLFADKAYDAAYLIALAFANAGAPPDVTGADLSTQLEKMSSGSRVTPGTNSFNAAVSTLEADGSIDFRGASGPLDFDNSTGDVSSTIVGWKIQKDTTSGDAEFVTTGPVSTQ